MATIDIGGGLTKTGNYTNNRAQMKQIAIFIVVFGGIFPQWGFGNNSRFGRGEPLFTLENTSIGRAVIEEDIDQFSVALRKLESVPNRQVVKILNARDEKDNNLLHLLAGAQGPHREQFAERILYLGYILLYFDLLDLALDAVNDQNRSPREWAEHKSNPLAIEYLGMIKNTTFQKPSQAQEQGPEMKELIRSNLFLSALSITSGLVFVDLALMTGNPSYYLLAFPPLTIGGYECIKAFKHLKKNKQSDE